MIKADFHLHELIFRKPSGTSRGILNKKKSWFLRIWDTEEPAKYGIGECSIIEGLSPETGMDIDQILSGLCKDLESSNGRETATKLETPAIKFAFETALLDLNKGGNRIIFDSSFTRGKAGIPINGLIWMNDISTMMEEVKSKIHTYPCIKIKVGATDSKEEINMLEQLRKLYGNNFEIRLDANEAFETDEALAILKKIEPLNIHSIEQPIKRRKWTEMSELISLSPIKIALDEELIGITEDDEREELLKTVKPDYLIFKPSLIGGLNETSKWVELCNNYNVKWWATSALESNIGLNAISQWAGFHGVSMPQGLGTGQLFTNNVISPLHIENGKLFYDPNMNWHINLPEAT